MMDLDEGRFEIKILDTGQIVHNLDELLQIARMIVQ